MPRLRSEKRITGTGVLIGISSGALLAANWRTVLKAGVKAGISAGLRMQALAVRGAENVADVTHEARSELHVALRAKQAQQAAAAEQANGAGAAGGTSMRV